jgi:tetratricopeptide (TPR) repeat protein
MRPRCRRAWPPFVATLLILCSSAAAADGAQNSAIDAAFDRLHRGDPDGAYRQFEMLATADPHDLSAVHGLLWALGARTRWERGLVQAYEERLDRFIADAEGRHHLTASDVAVRFYLAQGYMLRARYRLDQDKGIWSAARDAARARTHIVAYLQQHPEHGDAYLTLGLYNYYVDIAPTIVRFVRTLLFLPSGDRTQGLDELRRAATTGRWFAAPAREALLEIYGRYEHRPDLARAAGEPLVAQYPGNLDFRFALADTLAHPAIEEYDRAADEYAAIVTRAREAVEPRKAAAMTARAQLGRGLALLHAWRLDEAVASLSDVIHREPAEPAWALPQARLLRGICRGLRGEPQWDQDLQAILGTPSMQPWHNAANAQRQRLARHITSGDATVLVALLPGNRAVVERRWQDAHTVYDAAAARYPQDWQVRYRKAWLHFAEGHVDDARASFEAILAARTDRTDWIRIDAMLWLARTYDLLGRRPEALSLYKAVVADARGGDAFQAARTGLLTPYRAPTR